MNVKKDIKWPKKQSLVEAVEVVEKFREICKFQLDLGYWVTVAFPSKHHLNKILSTQYMDRDLMVEVYGEGFTNRLGEIVPLCKNYLAFLRGGPGDVEKDKK